MPRPSPSLPPRPTTHAARRGSAIGLLLLPVLLAGMALAQQAAAEQRGAGAALRDSLGGLIDRGGVAVGSPRGAVFVYRPGTYIPASAIKVATAGAALDALGPDYRFKTSFHLDGQRNLWVRGHGDPFLVSEEWALIAKELAKLGAFAQPLNRLMLDATAFSPEIEVDGASDTDNPYDARLGALVANFNTVFLRVDAKGNVTSAEPQTPLTPFAIELGRTQPPGETRINLSLDEQNSARYTAEVVTAIFGRAGARFSGGYGKGRVPAGLAPLLVHRNSRPLTEMIQGMMEYSNNFIANQMLVVMGIERYGEPGTLEQGVRLVDAYLTRKVGLDPRQFHLAEGSGLSRQNRIDLMAMLRAVDAFYPWRHLLRMRGKPPLDGRVKGGTLKGINTLAGFLPTAPGAERRPFVILLNQQRITRDLVYARLVEQFGPPPTALAPAPEPTPVTLVPGR